MKTKNNKNLVANLHDKTECVKHIRNLKQALKFKTNVTSWISLPKLA